MKRGITFVDTKWGKELQKIVDDVYFGKSDASADTILHYDILDAYIKKTYTSYADIIDGFGLNEGEITYDKDEIYKVGMASMLSKFIISGELIEYFSVLLILYLVNKDIVQGDDTVIDMLHEKMRAIKKKFPTDDNGRKMIKITRDYIIFLDAIKIKRKNALMSTGGTINEFYDNSVDNLEKLMFNAIYSSMVSVHDDFVVTESMVKYVGYSLIVGKINDIDKKIQFMLAYQTNRQKDTQNVTKLLQQLDSLTKSDTFSHIYDVYNATNKGMMANALIDMGYYKKWIDGLWIEGVINYDGNKVVLNGEDLADAGEKHVYITLGGEDEISEEKEPTFSFVTSAMEHVFINIVSGDSGYIIHIYTYGIDKEKMSPRLEYSIVVIHKEDDGTASTQILSNHKIEGMNALSANEDVVQTLNKYQDIEESIHIISDEENLILSSSVL